MAACLIFETPVSVESCGVVVLLVPDNLLQNESDHVHFVCRIPDADAEKPDDWYVSVTILLKL